MTVKVVALELDYTVWSGRLDEKRFGKGRGASQVIEDNLELVHPEDRVIKDRSDDRNRITLFPDVPGIIHDLLKRGIKIAVTSRNSSKALCNRALWHYTANDMSGRSHPIISLVTWNEVGNGSKVEQLERIRSWSGVDYKDMVLFDSDSSSSEVHQKLGVKFKLLDRSTGLGWREYNDALKVHGHHDGSGKKNGKPRLGKLLGSGRFGSTYESADDPNTVIKVMKDWSADMRPRLLEISSIINAGKPFKPGNSNTDQYLTMIAFELRNLQNVKQLKAPKLEHFTGWFEMTKVQGTLLWKTPLYGRHPFSVPFQRLVKTAFHLTVDEIEEAVKKYGIEHRDAHLANVMFTMKGDHPVKAHLFDWGIAVRMKWDGRHYIRGQDVIVWGRSEQGERYTPEEFRKYWITWMVKTEYEANMKRHSITHGDGEKFLKDLNWWFER